MLASESSVLLTIASPPDTPIGLYRLALEQVSKEVKEVSLGQFVLLFNPWCKSKILWWLCLKGFALDTHWLGLKHTMDFKLVE